MCPRVLTLVVCLCLPGIARADAFDRITNPELTKAPDAEGVRAIDVLTSKMLADHDRVLKNVTGTLVVVRTNEGRWSKLLIQESQIKFSEEKLAPAMLIDRFTTYKEGQERAVQAGGQNLCLFDGYRLNLDFGQIVPEDAPADLKCSVEAGSIRLTPLGKAKMYLVTKPLIGTDPKAVGKPEVGDAFEPRFFNGTYQLHDDGRRSGKLVLKVDEEGIVTGKYFSDRGGDEYEVAGKIGIQKHAIQFAIKFRQTEQTFQGMMFTGDAMALAGTAKMQNRETAFYAVRVEDK